MLQCPFSYVTRLEHGEMKIMTVNTKYDSVWRFYDEMVLQTDDDYVPGDNE